MRPNSTFSLLRAVALAAIVTMLTGGIALAAPLQGRVSLMSAAPFQAAEFELSSAGIPIGFAGQAMTFISQSRWFSMWGDLRHTLSESASIGLHAGLNRSWITLSTYTPETSATPYLGPIRYLVGASYHHRFGSTSLRANPTLVIVDFSTMNHLESIIIGPPLLEIGYRFTPSFGLGIRTSATPLRASWVF